MANSFRYHLGVYLFIHCLLKAMLALALSWKATAQQKLNFSLIFSVSLHKINNCKVATPAEQHGTGKTGSHPGRRGLWKTLRFSLSRCLGLIVPFQDGIYTTARVLGPRTRAAAEMGILSSSEMQYWQIKTSVNTVFY